MAKKKIIFSQKKAKLIIPRARLAMKNDFYLETSWLVSIAVEARLRTLITRIESMHPGAGYTLEQCLKRIKFLILKHPGSLVSSIVGVTLIDELRTWKNQRNLLFKAIESSHVSKKRMQHLAEEGIELMERMESNYKKYKYEWKHSLVKVQVKPEQEHMA